MKKIRTCSKLRPVLATLLAISALGPYINDHRLSAQTSRDQEQTSVFQKRKLSREETLQWIAEHKAWRLAKKTKPIWARPVESDEVGKEFQTAGHVKDTARAGPWLCVGVKGEPWFQARQKVEAKYEPDVREAKTFTFDTRPRAYRKYRPKGTVRNWVAQVKGPGIMGFSVRPGYDPERPLSSRAGVMSSRTTYPTLTSTSRRTSGWCNSRCSKVRMNS